MSPERSVDPAGALSEYLQREIPAARAMGIRVVEVSESGARLTAPYVPNANDHGSVFGGSVASLGILAGWTWVHECLRREGLEVGSVLRASELKFRAPAQSDLEAITTAPESRAVQRFLRGVTRFGRGRISVTTEIRAAGVVVADHVGDYAAGVEEAVERP